jgi:hypothetical protein
MSCVRLLVSARLISVAVPAAAQPQLYVGTYRIVALALSNVTGTFDAVRVVRVIIP